MKIGSQTGWVRREMDKAYYRGLAVFIDGVSYDPSMGDNELFVSEKDEYMMDFKGDKDGRIVEMNFNKIISY